MSLEGMLPIELIERKNEIERAIELNLRTINAYQQAPALIDFENQQKIDILTHAVLALEAEYKEITGEYYNARRR